MTTPATDTTCDHDASVGCDRCDPPGRTARLFGDGDGDYDEIDARDASEIHAEMLATQYDDDPNPYHGTYDDDGGFCADDF